MSVGGVNYVVPPALQGGNIPDHTFRGDNRPPDEIFRTGFQNRANGTISRASLLDYAEHNTAGPYVSTSRNADVAADFVEHTGGWVYEIDTPQDRAIDVNHVLGRDSPYPGEEEIAVAGGIAGGDVLRAINVQTGAVAENPNLPQNASQNPAPAPAPPPPPEPEL